MKEQTLLLALLMLSILAIPVLSVSASTRTLTISDNGVQVEMTLKAIKENGKTIKVDSFKITADNVLQIDDSVIVEDDAKITTARTIDSANNEKKIDVFPGNRISFGGYNPGVYVLDVIVDDMLAYEALISIGEEDSNSDVVNKQITKVNTEVFTDITIVDIFLPPPVTPEPLPPTLPPTDQPTPPTDQPTPPTDQPTPAPSPSLGAPAGTSPGSLDPNTATIPLCTTPDGQPGRLTPKEGGGVTCTPAGGVTISPPTTPPIADLPAPGQECFGFDMDIPQTNAGSNPCVNAPMSPIPPGEIEPYTPPIDCEVQPELCGLPPLTPPPTEEIDCEQQPELCPQEPTSIPTPEDPTGILDEDEEGVGEEGGTGGEEEVGEEDILEEQVNEDQESEEEESESQEEEVEQEEE